MAKFHYIDAEKAKDIHLLTIKHSGGGAEGILDFGKIESVLTHIQNDDYYPTFVDKLTHLFFCVCKFSPPQCCLALGRPSFEKLRPRLSFSLLASAHH
mgnify:CR=1 FL=1